MFNLILSFLFLFIRKKTIEIFSDLFKKNTPGIRVYNYYFPDLIKNNFRFIIFYEKSKKLKYKEYD